MRVKECEWAGSTCSTEWKALVGVKSGVEISNGIRNDACMLGGSITREKYPILALLHNVYFVTTYVSNS